MGDSGTEVDESPPQRRSWAPLLATIVIFGLTLATFGGDLFGIASSGEDRGGTMTVDEALPSARPGAERPVEVRLGRGRPAVVVFFDTTCQSCWAAISDLDDIAADAAARVDLLAVAVGTPRDDASTPSGASDRVPVVADRDRRLLDRAGVDHLPATVLVAADGVVVLRHGSMSPSDLRAEIDAAFPVRPAADGS